MSFTNAELCYCKCQMIIHNGRGKNTLIFKDDVGIQSFIH